MREKNMLHRSDSGPGVCACRSVNEHGCATHDISMTSRYVLRFFLSAMHILLSIALMLSGCADHRQTLFFLGDSMILEGQVDEEFTYPALIERQIPEFRTVVLERPGWTTNSYLQNWEDVEDDFPSRADFVFIQIGANDLKKYGQSDSVITNCINNMKEIMYRTSRRFPEAEIVLMSGNRIDYSKLGKGDAEGFNEETNSYLSRIGAGYAIIAADNKHNFIDLFRQMPIQSTDDGLHLNENGNNITTKIIISFLREYYLSKQGTEKDDSI